MPDAVGAPAIAGRGGFHAIDSERLYAAVKRRFPLFRKITRLAAGQDTAGITRAGTPTAVAPAGTSHRTTLMAPIFAPLPIRTPPSTCA